MLFRNPRKPEIIIQEPSSAEPAAVVILFGWFGSKLRHVSKYAELYENCVTISTTLDDRTVLIIDRVKIHEMVDMLTHEAAKLLRKYPKAPFVCHAFSNGGGIPLQCLEQYMVKAETEDHQLLQSRYTTSIFDSGPAFPDMETFERAVTAALPNMVVRTLLLWIVGFYYQLSFLMQKYLYQQEAWSDLYWRHWETCPLPSQQQVYVYSTADKIAKSEKLDQLVETRRRLRQESGNNDTVMALKFTESAHVQHLMAHKLEYKAMLQVVLKKASVGVSSTHIKDY